MSMKLGTISLNAVYLGTTSIAALYLGAAQVFGGGAVEFDPASLFASGEEGAWYEPSTTTAFTDTTATTAASYGDPVAFLLDKSQGAGYADGSFTGLGSELVTDGGFDVGTVPAGWAGYGASTASSTLSVVSNALRVTKTGSTAGFCQYTLTGLIIGKVYLFSAEFLTEANSVFGGSTSSFDTSPDFGETTYSVNAGVRQFSWVATATTAYLIIATSAASVDVDNISVRELPGNHATQTTLASRPILARVPEGGRRNLLERTEEFDDAYWTQGGVEITTVGADTFDGVPYDLITQTQNWTVTAARIFVAAIGRTASIYAKAGTNDKITIRSIDGLRYAIFDLTNGTVDKSNLNVADDAIITPQGSGYYRCEVRAPSDMPNFYVGLYGTTGQTVYLGGPQLEPGSTATDYQKVVDEYDITEAGVTSLEYLSFDGVDDGIATASIDFTSTDKMSVFAGVRKITDTTGLNASAIVESSAAADANNGSFFLFGRNGFAPAAQYQVGSRGTTFVLAGTNDAAFAAPVTNVVTGLGDIAGDTATLRIDGVQVAQNTSDQGAGNYLTYPLYIGRRAGSTLPFDGHIYGLIVRGASSTTDEITNTEAYLATRSGVTL